MHRSNLRRIRPQGIRLLILSALLLNFHSGVGAQPAQGRGAAGRVGPDGPVVVSPEVLPDRRVIVRFYAPEAQQVRAVFEGAERTSGAPSGGSLTKGPDGVWQATLGPLDAGAYRYNFSVDGAIVTDPRNIETERMQVMTRGILYVPGAAFMDTKDVPHGAVSLVTYFSKVLNKFRRFHIYTPPGYEGNQQKYPVLYLLHGANESDDSWSTVGRAGFILDNLIADGKAVPMMVVMPNGHVDQTPPSLGGAAVPGSPPPIRRELVDFPKEFVGDIMPYVEGHYRTIPDRAHRAIAGLSMGGSQTLNIVFANIEKFSAVGVFSSGILGGSQADWEKEHLAGLGDPKLKKGLKTIWFSTGSADFLLANSKATAAMLNKHGFAATFRESDGAHTWANWRNYLQELAPQLFR